MSIDALTAKHSNRNAASTSTVTRSTQRTTKTNDYYENCSTTFIY